MRSRQNICSKEFSAAVALQSKDLETHSGTSKVIEDVLMSGNSAKTQKRKLDEERKALPMWGAREKLLEAVADAPVLVVVGETGSGKTTQVR